MSEIGWIDYDQSELEQVHRQIKLLNGKESRDELGIGAVRDSISDHLFPGTTTLQTRLRYMLFIPWIFLDLEKLNKSGTNFQWHARNKEIQLIKALKTGNEKVGVIGSQAGEGLKILPSSVYWSALRNLGILKSNYGSKYNLFKKLSDRSINKVKQEDEDELQSPIWIESLPNKPEKFLECTKFTLRECDAEFIVERLNQKKYQNSLLTHLANSLSVEDFKSDYKCKDFIWQCPISDAPDKAVQIVSHGKNFSLLMHGAMLYYNYFLSNLHTDWEPDCYLKKINKWHLEMKKNRKEFDCWSLVEFWETVIHSKHKIDFCTKIFVKDWLNLVRKKYKSLVKDIEAENLIKSREKFKKGKYSRFNDVNQWRGDSGLSRLDFRWDTAKSHLRDIIYAK